MFQSFKKFLQSFIAPSEHEKLEKKPAIALITYCRSDYFEKVLNSILAQQFNKRPLSDFFELYIFKMASLKTHLKQTHMATKSSPNFANKNLIQTTLSYNPKT
jgi:hypothetical protein